MKVINHETRIRMIDTNDIAALADLEARPQMQPDNAGRDQAGRFVKGVSGNPKGMPKGNSVRRMRR